MITITLPWPPSVNHYWRTWRGRMLISRQGRAYREQVGAILKAASMTPQAGPLAVHVELYPPDRRKRDVDNTFKAIGDSLQHGGVFQDDSQIVWLLLERAEGVAGGKVIVRVAEKTGDPLPFPTSECVCLN